MDMFTDSSDAATRTYITFTSRMHATMEAARKLESIVGKPAVINRDGKVEVGDEKIDGARIIGYFVDEAGGVATEGGFTLPAGSWKGLVSIDPPPLSFPRPEFNSDGKVKQATDHEPFYVSKTRRKRR